MKKQTLIGITLVIFALIGCRSGLYEADTVLQKEQGSESWQAILQIVSVLLVLAFTSQLGKRK